MVIIFPHWGKAHDLPWQLVLMSQRVKISKVLEVQKIRISKSQMKTMGHEKAVCLVKARPTPIKKKREQKVASRKEFFRKKKCQKQNACKEKSL